MSVTGISNQHAAAQRGFPLAGAISEHENTVKALRDSEMRYRRLFESAKDGILILDAYSGAIVDVNPFLTSLLGYSYEEFVGKSLWDIGEFKDVAASKDAFKVLQDNEYIRYEHLPIETREGRAIAVEFVSNVYQVDGANVIQCNIRDITRRRELEVALAGSESKLLTILDNIGVGVALISPDMQILELNRRLRAWFPSLEPGQHPISYCAAEGVSRDTTHDGCPTQSTIQDGLVHEGIAQIPSNGMLRHYRILSSPIANESGEVTAAIEMVEDITEKLSLESLLRQSQKLEAVGQLAGGVAHDFNNMLGVILGHAELALSKVDPAQPLYTDIEEILKAANRSVALTQQLLAFARKQTIKPVVLDLNAAIVSALKMIQRLIGENIRLVWRPDSDECSIKMDPVQVDQILTNLCVNARDAIADIGQVTIATGFADFDDSFCENNSGYIPGQYILLSVGDDGGGMSKLVLDRIFEPFFTSKEVGKGTGLGLATVYGIVRQNKGFIHVYSEPGYGTNFKIYLPRYAMTSKVPLPEKTLEAPRGNGETVLLVEDEPAILELTKRMLEASGYRVLIAGSPGEALAIAEETSISIQLLLTDVIMPEMNGKSLSERLRSLNPELRVLYMSGYTADVIANKGVLDEEVNFVQKPFTWNDLAIKVSQSLGK